MDLNSPLIKSYFSFGHFNFRQDGQPKRSKLLLNWAIKLVIFVNAAKLAIIALNVKIPNLKFWLLEMYMFEERDQKVVDIGMTVIQFGLCACFSYWISLNGNVNVLSCFNFLFISDYKALCRYYRKHYHLDLALTEKFLARYRLFSRFLRPTLVIYGSFLVGLVSRCLFASYYTVGSTYFLRVSPFLFLCTITTYLIMDFYGIPKFLLVFLSGEFLLLRVRAIDRLVFSRFKRVGHFAANLTKFNKSRPKTFKVLFALNDFARQFKAINDILDSSLSRMLLGAYFAQFGLPYFIVFVENSHAVRLFVTLMAISTALLCYSISLMNDLLRRRASSSN